MKISILFLFESVLEFQIFIQRIVAAGFSLRSYPSDEYMEISRKLRNLKVAATKIA
jgi:hypothetical protein